MNEKISSRQAILLITINMLTTVITLMSILSISPNNQDVWLSIGLSILYMIILNAPILYFSNKYKDLNMFQWIELITGKFVGKIIIFLYGLFFLSIVLLYCNTTIQMIRNSFLPQTKPVFVIFFLVVTCIFINKQGIFTIMRLAEFFVPIIIVTFLFFILIGINQIELTRIIPIYRDSTFFKINLGALQVSLIFQEILILSIITPKLENPKNLNKIYIKGSIYSLILIIIISIVIISSLGLQQSKHLSFPFLTYIRSIVSYSILERMEPFYIIVWIISMVIRLSIYFYMAIEAMKKVFNKKGNSIIYILGIFCFSVTNYLSDVYSLLRELTGIQVSEYIYYGVFRVIPFFILITYLFRRKKIEKKLKRNI